MFVAYLLIINYGNLVNLNILHISRRSAQQITAQRTNLVLTSLISNRRCCLSHLATMYSQLYALYTFKHDKLLVNMIV